MPFFLARSSIIAVGSDPMDSRQIIGQRGSLSSHIALRSRITGSAYLEPIESEMYLRACDAVLSGHQDLQRTQTTQRRTSLTLNTAADLAWAHRFLVPRSRARVWLPVELLTIKWLSLCWVTVNRQTIQVYNQHQDQLFVPSIWGR